MVSVIRVVVPFGLEKDHVKDAIDITPMGLIIPNYKIGGNAVTYKSHDYIDPYLPPYFKSIICSLGLEKDHVKDAIDITLLVMAMVPPNMSFF